MTTSTIGNHTPGPWKWIGTPARPGSTVLLGADGTQKILARDHKTPMSQNDARLILEAPTLLAELHKAGEAYNELTAEETRLREALSGADAIISGLRQERDEWQAIYSRAADENQRLREEREALRGACLIVQRAFQTATSEEQLGELITETAIDPVNAALRLGEPG